MIFRTTSEARSPKLTALEPERGSCISLKASKRLLCRRNVYREVGSPGHRSKLTLRSISLPSLTRCTRAKHEPKARSNKRPQAKKDRSPTADLQGLDSSAGNERHAHSPDLLLYERGAWCFLIGSIALILASLLGMSAVIDSCAYTRRLFVLWPYALASLVFTYGQLCYARQAALQCGLAIQGGRRLYWLIVDLIGALTCLLGTVLYNSSCITPVLLDLEVKTILGCTDPTTWYLHVPNTAAGVLFVIGSCLALVAACESWKLKGCKPRDTSFRGILYYLQGSVCFVLGAVTMMRPVFHGISQALTMCWCALFFGYLLGSCCFARGSQIFLLHSSQSRKVFREPLSSAT